MDKAIIIENITRQLELIVEQNNSTSSYSGKIPQIDMDIIKANIRKLYEQYCELERVNRILTVDKVKERIEEIPAVIDEIKETPENPLIIVHENNVVVEKTIEEAKDVMVEETIIEEKHEIIKETIIEDNSVMVEKTIIEEKPLSMVVDEKVEVIFAPEPKAIFEDKVLEIREETTYEEKTTHTTKSEVHIDLFGNAATTTIADKYKDETRSLNEKMLKNKTDKSISSRMQHNAIKDLKSAIGINEKFLFINELFKGNMKEYTDSILKLNDFKTLEEAEHFLDEMKNRHKWDNDMVAYLTLKDFVERKHF